MPIRVRYTKCDHCGKPFQTLSRFNIFCNACAKKVERTPRAGSITSGRVFRKSVEK